MRTRRPLALAALLAAALLSTAGCGDAGDYLNPQPSKAPMSREQQYAELLKRPDVESMQETYEKLRLDLRQSLSQEFGISNWAADPKSASFSNCTREFPDLPMRDVQKVHPETWQSPNSISLDTWSRMVPKFESIAAKYGFNKVLLSIARGDHVQHDLGDAFGAELSLGAAENTVLSLTTGCHLTAEAKRRGTPAGSRPA